MISYYNLIQIKLLDNNVMYVYIVYLQFAFKQNLDEVSHCVAVLKVLRLATQTALHKEELCWLVFNGNHNFWI